MAGRRNGPRPGWENLPPEKQEYLRKQSERWFDLKAEARKYAKLEGFLQAHQESAANFFRDKIAFVNAMIDTVRDPDSGEIDVEAVRRMEARDKKILLDAFEKIEKSAGFAQSVTHKHQHEHTLTLADQFKQQQALESGEEVYDAEVIEDE